MITVRNPAATGARHAQAPREGYGSNSNEYVGDGHAQHMQPAPLHMQPAAQHHMQPAQHHMHMPPGNWGAPAPAQAPPPMAVPGVPVTGKIVKNKLFVSNLEPAVTDNDIVELFQVAGPIKDSAVHYDKRWARE